MLKTREPRTEGWLVIARSEYEKMLAHGYAGTDADGTVWAVAMDSARATCLWKGLEIEEGR